MSHTKKGPTAVACSEPQRICQHSKLTAREIADQSGARKGVEPAYQSAASLAAITLSRRFGLSLCRAALVADLAGLAVWP